LRAVGEPVRGVGKVSLEHLKSFADEHEMCLTEACRHLNRISALKGKAAAGLKEFADLMTELRGLQELPPHEIIKSVIVRSGYHDMLMGTGDEEDLERLANVEEMISAAKQFADENPAATLGDFLEQITLASDVDAWDEQVDHVSIMTLHASKGLEFRVVYVLAVEEGLIPHERSLHDGKGEEKEEERRLLFVGMTRAKKELYLTNVQMRDFRGQTLYAIPSSFLDELPADGVEREVRSRHAGRKIAHDFFRGGNPAAESAWKETGISTSGPVVGSAKTIAGTIELSSGQIVQHDSYGIGQITDVNGFGALRKIRIRFAIHGEKTFIADQVKLKVVPKR
jgi:DNA helicase II / ATP-dependent DNA helicase PcrA